MNTFLCWMGLVIIRLCEGLLPLYPDHFRKTFNNEIQDILHDIVVEAEVQGGSTVFSTSFRELKSLVISITKERWHALKHPKEKGINPEENLSYPTHPGAGGSSL